MKANIHLSQTSPRNLTASQIKTTTDTHANSRTCLRLILAVYMKRLFLTLSILVASISLVIYNSTTLKSLLDHYSPINISITFSKIFPANQETHTEDLSNHMNSIKSAMSKTLHHAKITPHRSSTRGHSDHGWLNTYHSFSFADCMTDPPPTHCLQQPC